MKRFSRVQQRVIYSQPSWVIANDQMELAVTKLGAHMATVTFFRHSRRPVQPYYISPWQDEKVEVAVPVLAPLRGEHHPPHDEACGSRWKLENCAAPGEVLALRLGLDTREYQFLAPDAAFRNLSKVPSIFRDQTAADCTVFPTRRGFCDLVQVFDLPPARPTKKPSWTVAVNREGGWLWFAFKDPRVMPGRGLWMENRIRSPRCWMIASTLALCALTLFGLAATKQPAAKNAPAKTAKTAAAKAPPAALPSPIATQWQLADGAY